MNPVKLLRAQTGKTQKQVADLAGTSQPTIAQYEIGDKSPTLETLEKLARSLGLEAVVSFVPPLTREDRRSLAYHRAVVDLLKTETDLTLKKARKNLTIMAKKHSGARNLFRQWKTWLQLPLEELIVRILDPGLNARDMRQVSPFAGVLAPEVRREVLAEFKKGELRE